jgi:hypothetical protein
MTKITSSNSVIGSVKGRRAGRRGRDRGGNTAGSYSRRAAKAKAAPLKGILKAEV